MKLPVTPGIFALVLMLLASPLTLSAQEIATYEVKPGDTLFSIARSHDISVSDIREWNDLQDGVIRAGMTLNVESADKGGLIDEERGAVEDPDSRSIEVEEADSTSLGPVGTVKSLGGGRARLIIGEGETLYSLAARFGLHPDTLLSMNPDFPSFLSTGETVVIPQDRTTTTYRVKTGDTLFGISLKTGVSVETIRSTNDLTGSNIRIGQRLSLPSTSLPATEDGVVRLPLRDEIRVLMYPNSLAGRMLSSGHRYDPKSYMVSHPELAMGSILLLSLADGSEETFAIVADHSLSLEPPIMDISPAVAEALGIEKGGDTVLVRVVH
jgi:LysM repeat protein